MKHISIIVPSGNAIIDTIIAPYNLLRMANAHYKRINQSNEDFLKIDLVGLTREPVLYQGFCQITPTRSINEIKKTDLIVVTAISGDLEKEIANNVGFIPWIKKHRIENDAEIASLCKGGPIIG